MLKIGLTGGIGSGKTKVSKIFAEKGFKILIQMKLQKRLSEMITLLKTPSLIFLEQIHTSAII